MNKKSLFGMLPLLAATVLAVTHVSAAEKIKPVKRVLWASAPAREGMAWQSSVYPLGNGRLGCTVFGDPKKERIQFNEDSLWVGNEDNTGGYQPFGDLYVETTQTNFTDYRRELDISRAVQTITYKSGGVSYQRDYFASHPAQVVVIRLSASTPGALTGKVSLGNEHEVPVTAKNETLTMTGDTSKFWWWQAQLKNQATLLASRQYASATNMDLNLEAQARLLHEGGTLKTVKEETRKVLKVNRGWLMRSENNIFGGSTWHIQKGDSAWLCQNLWDHYTFTQDQDYLKRYAYPVMKEISEFWVDHLKALPDGTLVAPDGRSPEHGPAKAEGALTQAIVRGVSNGSGKCAVRYGKGSSTLTLAKGESRVLRAKDFGVAK